MTGAVVAEELGHEGVLDAHRVGHVADERLEELLAYAGGGAFDDGAEHGEVVRRAVAIGRTGTR